MRGLLTMLVALAQPCAQNESPQALQTMLKVRDGSQTGARVLQLT